MLMPTQVLIADLYPTATHLTPPSTHDSSMSEINCLNSHTHHILCGSLKTGEAGMHIILDLVQTQSIF